MFETSYLIYIYSALTKPISYLFPKWCHGCPLYTRNNGVSQLIFLDLSDPKTRYFYSNLTWHCENLKMDKLRQRYFEEHPNVRATLTAGMESDRE